MRKYSRRREFCGFEELVAIWRLFSPEVVDHFKAGGPGWQKRIDRTLMDISLFAYWWTGVAGRFTVRPIREMGPDGAFALTCAVLAASLSLLWLSMAKLRQSRVPLRLSHS